MSLFLLRRCKLRMLIQKILYTVLFITGTAVLAKDDNPFGITMYGSFIHATSVPNTLFVFDEIEQYDSFEFRRAMRNHNIDTVVLASPGGSVWEGLNIAGIIHDNNIFSYVPKLPKNMGCFSACSYMFFAGKIRKADGLLAVHQAGTYGSDRDQAKEKVSETQQSTQFTVSEIIGFLNEFQTPPWVYEKMFRSRELYAFNDTEKSLLAARNNEINEKNLANINEFIPIFLNYLNELTTHDLTSQEEPQDEVPEEKPQFEEEEKIVKQNEIDEPLKPQIIETTKTTDVASPSKNNIAEKALIKKIQARLKQIGCNPGPADGIWGRRTQLAAVTYAELANIVPDPKLGFKTKAFLQQILGADAQNCPRIKMIPQKTKLAKIEDWGGHTYCTVIDGKLKRKLKIQHIDNNSFILRFPYLDMIKTNNAEVKLTAKTENKNGDYSFMIDSVRFSININFSEGVIHGKMTETNLAIRALLGAFLVSGTCDIYFRR